MHIDLELEENFIVIINFYTKNTKNSHWPSQRKSSAKFQIFNRFFFFLTNFDIINFPNHMGDIHIQNNLALAFEALIPIYWYQSTSASEAGELS